MITDMSLTRKYTFQFAPHTYDANDFLLRNHTQNKRPHEPRHVNSNIEPNTGNDVPNRASRANPDDGNLIASLETD